MPDLVEALQPSDLRFLRIIADFWGLALSSADPMAARQELAKGMLAPDAIHEMVDTLPEEAAGAIQTLVTQNGRLSWAELTRRFGELRQVGSGRRDREGLHRAPTSTTELLFYRGLLYRAFFESSTGLQEFGYIPSDLLTLLPAATRQGQPQVGRPATSQESSHPIPASDRILEDACTLLAGLRLGWDSLPEGNPIAVAEDFLKSLLLANQLISPAGQDGYAITSPVAVREFLKFDRGEALARLVSAWKGSGEINELRLIPGLVCEGTWKNDPMLTRVFLLDLLSGLATGKWWSLSGLIQDIRTHIPGFQRPAGDFDSWLIRRQVDGLFLHGFDHWEDVEGALIRYFICGPLFWLGLVDLASEEEGAEPSAFRWTTWSGDLLAGRGPADLKPEDGSVQVNSNGRISLQGRVARSLRYQVARFCEWEPARTDEFRYRLTTGSLKAARGQGLKISQLLSLLKKHVEAPLPPAFLRALNRYDLYGTEAILKQPLVLKLGRVEVLEELRKSRAARYLGEVLGPLTVEVRPGARDKVLAALAEMGLLVDDQQKADIIDAGESIHK